MEVRVCILMDYKECRKPLKAVLRPNNINEC